jgi:tetratricopeptide (TPR) repeat protein
MASGAFIDDNPLKIALVKRVVAIDEKNLGGDDPVVASDLRNLALLSARTGDDIEAGRSYGRAVEIAERAEQMDSFERSMIFAGAADFHKQQKQYKEAERLLRRAMEIAAGMPSSQPSQHSRFRASLAEVLRLEGKEAEADLLLAEPPATASTSQTDRDSTAEADTLRARQYVEEGKLGEAEVFYRHAISVGEKDPEKAPWLVLDLDELAGIYHSEKRDVEAEELYRRAISLRETSLRTLAPLSARTLAPVSAIVLSFPFGLQYLLRDQGRLAEIEPVYEQALKIQEQYVGPNDYSIANTLHMLASVYREQGKFEAALPLCQRSLKIAEREFGADDARVGAILNEYAQNLEALGRTHEAAAMRTRAERSESKSSPQ